MRPSPATPSYGTTSSWNIAIGMGRGNFGYGFESIHSSPRYPEPGPRHLTRCPLRQYSDLASFLPVFHHFLCSHLTSPKPLLQTSLINLLTIERSLTSKKKKSQPFPVCLRLLWKKTSVLGSSSYRQYGSVSPFKFSILPTSKITWSYSASRHFADGPGVG